MPVEGFARLFPALSSGGVTAALDGATAPAGTGEAAGSLYPTWGAALGANFGATAAAPDAGAALPGSGQALGTDGAAAEDAAASLGPWQAQIAAAAEANGIPTAVLTALVEQESGGNPLARSSAGAMGLTQLMPATAAALGVTDPYDPVQSLWGGAAYLGDLLRQFGNLPLALAAYNAGPGAVERWGGIPPYPQTQAYVANVLRLAGVGTGVGSGAAGTAAMAEGP